jgi:hypothetical protein
MYEYTEKKRKKEKVITMDFKKQRKLLIEQNNALCIHHTMATDCLILRP